MAKPGWGWAEDAVSAPALLAAKAAGRRGGRSDTGLRISEKAGALLLEKPGQIETRSTPSRIWLPSAASYWQLSRVEITSSCSQHDAGRTADYFSRREVAVFCGQNRFRSGARAVRCAAGGSRPLFPRRPAWRCGA